MNTQLQTIELLKLLGEDTAEAVLAHLAPAQAAELRAGLTTEDSFELDRDDRRSILDQFGRFMDFAAQNDASLFGDPFAPSLYNEQQGSNGRSDRNSPGDATTARSSRETGDSEASSDTSQNNAASQEEAAPPQLTGDPLHDLSLLSVYQVAGALETEQPRTIAILLGEFTFQQTADVLSLLAPDHQAAVVKEMAQEIEAPRVLVDRIAKATLHRGLTLPASEPDRRDRLDRLSDVLRAVPKKLRRNMMTGIEEEDQEMSQALLKKLYRFEDLTSLDARVIQQVLGEVDGTTLTTAMFQAPTEVVDTILGNLSKRARQSIEEELSFQSSVPEARVEAARDSVAEVIARLDQESE
jgi:flagellar motor switch protein FliG